MAEIFTAKWVGALALNMLKNAGLQGTQCS